MDRNNFRTSRVCWQQGKNEIKYRTITNIIEKESCKIIAQIENKLLDILKKNGFNPYLSSSSFNIPF